MFAFWVLVGGSTLEGLFPLVGFATDWGFVGLEGFLEFGLGNGPGRDGLPFGFSVPGAGIPFPPGTLFAIVVEELVPGFVGFGPSFAEESVPGFARFGPSVGTESVPTFVGLGPSFAEEPVPGLVGFGPSFAEESVPGFS